MDQMHDNVWTLTLTYTHPYANDKQASVRFEVSGRVA